MLKTLPNSSVRLIWWLTFVLMCLPLVNLSWLTWQSLSGQGRGLGANPVEYITHSTGDWGLYLLVITLTLTPVRLLLGMNWVIRLRRLSGLMSFLYLCLHFLAFFWFDHNFDLVEMWQDVIKRPFITVGMIAFLGMVILAITSNHWAMHWLGRRWQRLHRIVYGIAILGILHYWWDKAGKNVISQPRLFAYIVATLLLVRVIFWFKKRQS